MKSSEKNLISQAMRVVLQKNISLIYLIQLFKACRKKNNRKLEKTLNKC